MYGGDNAFWNQRTACVSLLVGVIVSVAGVAVLTTFHAYVFGGIVTTAGVLLSLAAYIMYRL